MKRYLFYVALTFTSLYVKVASADEPSQWGLGAAGAFSLSPYAGKGERVTPIPLVTYESDRLFFFGITGGVHLVDEGSLKLDAIVQGRLDGIDADDFGLNELARNGIDRSLLSDRKDGIDAGLAAKFNARFGEVSLSLLTDITGASKGTEVTLGYGYPFALSNNFVLTPSLGASWQSSKMANYYYGILDEEAARGLTEYKPGASLSPKIGLSIDYGFAERWNLLARLSYVRFSSDVSDSPLLDSDHSMSAILAIRRSF